MRVYLSRLVEQLPPWLIVLLGVSLLLAVGLTDYVTGPEIDLFIFYLFPVLFVTWFSSPYLGVVFGLVASVQSVLPDHLVHGVYSSNAVFFWNLLVRFLFFVALVLLADSLRKALARAAALSDTDTLTGLSNRRSFRRSLNEEIERSRRYGRPLSLVYFDIDNFKAVNDRAGHEEGDRLLQATGNVLRKTTRKVDAPARLGGDEFVIALPGLGSDGAKEFAARLDHTFAQAMRRHGWPVSLSAGLVTFNDPPESIDAALGEADAAMYRAKLSGKNRIEHRTLGQRKTSPAN